MTRQEELRYELLRLKKELDILEQDLTPYTKPIEKNVLATDKNNIDREIAIFNKIINLLMDEI